MPCPTWPLSPSPSPSFRPLSITADRVGCAQSLFTGGCRVRPWTLCAFEPVYHCQVQPVASNIAAIIVSHQPSLSSSLLIINPLVQPMTSIFRAGASRLCYLSGRVASSCATSRALRALRALHARIYLGSSNFTC